jgi:putative transposase
MTEILQGMEPDDGADVRLENDDTDVLGVADVGTGLDSLSAAELDIAGELVRAARARGVALTGPDGMLKALTKTVFVN